ncbi:MAG: hypothetical protein AAGJ18_27180, partial [Bacteroidota bacterium]
MNYFLHYLLGLNADFKRIFFNNEYKALAGRGGRTIIALLVILFLTFLALGFAVGSLGDLKEKMDNPFTNWVDLSIADSHIAQQITAIKNRYEDTVGVELNIKNSSGFSRFFQDFYVNESIFLRKEVAHEISGFWGRTIASNSDLLTAILNPATSNLLWSATSPEAADFYELSDCEIIVTAYMLEELDYKDSPLTNYIMLTDEDLISGQKSPLFIKIKAVVKELPSFCRFAVTPKLYNILKGNRVARRQCDDFIRRNQKGENTFSFITEGDAAIQEIQGVANTFFKNRPSVRKSQEKYDLGNTTLNGVRLSFLPTDVPSPEKVDTFIQQVKRKRLPISALSTMECEVSGCQSINDAELHYLAFNFERLGLIRAFSNDINEKFDIEIDMTQVEAKENFALVSQLTLAISLILLGFGILSIVLFVNNLLRTHLFEVRSNLGTFQAFGLTNEFLVTIYLKIIFSFLALSVFVAFALAATVDLVEHYFSNGESRFDVFSVWIAFAVLGLVVVSLILSARTINKILGETPGNLIY